MEKAKCIGIKVLFTKDNGAKASNQVKAKFGKMESWLVQGFFNKGKL